MHATKMGHPSDATSKPSEGMDKTLKWGSCSSKGMVLAAAGDEHSRVRYQSGDA